jgi:hypothetical protein
MNPSWRDINRVLKDFTEDQLNEMIDSEIRTLKRVTVVERLHQRLCSIRNFRERKELLDRMYE